MNAGESQDVLNQFIFYYLTFRFFVLFYYIFFNKHLFAYIFKHLLSAEDTVLMLTFLGQKICLFKVCCIWPNCSWEGWTSLHTYQQGTKTLPHALTNVEYTSAAYSFSGSFGFSCFFKICISLIANWLKVFSNLAVLLHLLVHIPWSLILKS